MAKPTDSKETNQVIEVTPEMVEAGQEELRLYSQDVWEANTAEYSTEAAERIYRAMELARLADPAHR